MKRKFVKLVPCSPSLNSVFDLKLAPNCQRLEQNRLDESNTIQCWHVHKTVQCKLDATGTYIGGNVILLLVIFQHFSLCVLCSVSCSLFGMWARFNSKVEWPLIQHNLSCLLGCSILITKCGLDKSVNCYFFICSEKQVF